MIKSFIINNARNFFGPPRQNYNFLPLNVLGFQVFRYIFSYFKFEFIKTKKNSDAFYSLNENGYVIIKNFLSDSEFKKILELTRLIEEKKIYKIKKFGEKKVHSFDFYENLLNKKDDPNNIEDQISFLKNKINNLEFLNEIFSLLKLNKKNKVQNLSYEKIMTEENFVDRGDVNSEFHADRFYPCIKMFLYLDDNKVSNGAFTYIAKSHKFSISRLFHEYIYSILISGKKIFEKIMPFFGYQLRNDRVTFTDTKIKKIFGASSVIECEAPKNSLVICNNKGFHKRGTFQSNQIRTHIRLNLYDLQTPRYKRSMYNWLKKIKSKNSFFN